MKTICFIYETPIPVNQRKVCLLDKIKEAGYNLILLDVSYVINRTSYEKNRTGLLDDRYAPIVRAKSYSKIKEYIYGIEKPAIIVTRVPWSLSTYPIFRWIERRNIAYGYLSLNEYDDFSISKRKTGISFKNNITIKRVLNAVFVRIPKCILLNKCASFIVTNTVNRAEMYKNRYTATTNSDVLYLHSNVYEEGLELKGVDRIIKEDYCVWLDTYTPYHTDLLDIGIKVDPEKYYSSLRNFFRVIEDKMGLKVVIAAHPKADYSMHKEAYEGFQIIHNNSCLLCRDSSLVLSCASMSTMYALLYNKPILFIKQESLIEAGLQTHLDAAEYLAESIGSRVINIDSENINSDYLKSCICVDKDRYKQKICEWIKADYDGSIHGESSIDALIRFWRRYLY